MKVFNTLKYCLILSVIIATSLCTGTDTLAQSQDPSPKRVLAIFVFKHGMPWPYRLEQSLRKTLTSDSSYPIELDIEYADQLTFSKKAYLDKVVDLYRYKYKFNKQKVDLILVLGDESANLILEYGESLFGDIPVALITLAPEIEPPSRSSPNIVSLTWGFDLSKMGGLIQDLLPKTKHLFVISGTSLTDRKFKNLAVEALAEVNDRFATHYLDDLSLEDLLVKVTQLPEDSAISLWRLEIL